MSTSAAGASRILTWPLEAVVVLYRTLVSPALPQSCRYYPSCSAYALTALRRFGPLVGVWLTLRRLARCHPWCAGGVDHVPPRGSWGLPDWAAYRELAAEREARWLAEAQDATPHDVRHDGCEESLAPSDERGAPPRHLIPVNRGMR